MRDDERRARRALACVVEAGNPRVAALVEKAGAQEVWRLVLAVPVSDGASEPDAWARRAAVLDLDAVLAAEGRSGMRFVIPGDEEWPSALDALHHCPVVQDLGGVPVGLWVRGVSRLAAAAATSVSIVGSRACTPYGERVASGLASDLVAGGVTVISGGAYGIDAAAHRGALAEGGPTIGVLACGLDQPYPKSNAPLLEQVGRHGVLVSEYAPGQHPTRPRFLARNRLIAALSQGTVIVEGSARSGARNTVTWATGCSRPVMAVPGPVGNGTSYMPHHLIREGEALLVTCAADVREVVQPLGSVDQRRPRVEHLLDTLSDDQRAAYEALPSRGGRDAGEVSVRSGLPMARCLAALGGLSVIGLAVRKGDGRWALGMVTNRPLLPSEAAATTGTS